jgi:hypothetical protein
VLRCPLRFLVRLWGDVILPVLAALARFYDMLVGLGRDAQRAPCEVHSVHFAFAGGPAITLRNPVNGVDLGAVPEWVADPARDEMVAYVRGARPELRVIFKGLPDANGTYVVGARGGLCQVAEGQVALAFDPASGLSEPVSVNLASPLPDQIGLHQARFEWYVRKPENRDNRLAAGVTTHQIATTWRAMVPNPSQRLGGWAYAPLVKWTSQWAQGLDDEKAICDAIITNLPTSGLKYGVGAPNIPAALVLGGAMCGVWSQIFQAMAHAQGVFVHRRSLLVDARQMARNEEMWSGIVILSGGMNQPEPTHPATEFHDNDVHFPVTEPVALVTRTERRYRFYGISGWTPANLPVIGDGHCFNLLEYGGRLYLYDACFASGPFEIAAALPPTNLSTVGGTALTPFKAAYLDGAIDYMLGTLYNGADLHQTEIRTVRNGMTVRTSLIPESVGGIDTLTFFWGP